MSLDQHTLSLLTAKDNLSEARLHAGAAYVLQAEAEAYSLWKIPLNETPARISGDLALGSRLPFSGQLYALDAGVAVLTRDHKIHKLGSGEAWDLPGPSTDLAPLPGDRLAFITEANGEDRLCSLDTQTGKITILYATANRLRHLSWHPLRNEGLALEWSRRELPWHAARLVHLTRDANGVCSRVSLHPPGLEQAACGEATFSPDGRLAAATFLTGSFFQVWLYKFRTRNWVQLSMNEREHSFPLRRSGRRTLVFLDSQRVVSAASHKAFWRLEEYDAYGHLRLHPSKFTHMAGLAADQDELLVLGSGLERPLQLARFQAAAHAWDFLGPRVPATIIAEPLTWASADGATVHGLLYRDRNAKGPLPLILPIHGGPGDAVHATWPSKALAFTERGYAVLYVNFRGSFGYGDSYHQALAGHWGHRELADCVSGVRSLVDSGAVARDKVGLWGGGSASYSVLWGLLLYPEIFHAGVVVFPILDLPHHLETCAEAERLELQWALGPEADLGDRSPLAAISRLKRPLGLFTGSLDRQCRESDRLAVAEALKIHGTPYWQTVYEGEGRTFKSPKVYSDYYSQVAGFFDRFLKFRQLVK